MGQDQARAIRSRILPNRSVTGRQVLDLAAVTLVLVGLLDPLLLTAGAPPGENRFFRVDPGIPVSGLFFRFGERSGRPVLNARKVEGGVTACVRGDFTWYHRRCRRRAGPDGLLR
jgi:hypothetical protein